jgi:pSer/pThr/pTyr-binding forkhead associated (FHA) protein
VTAPRRLALTWTCDGRQRHVAIPEVGALYMGRDPDCDVVFHDGAFSRRHALVYGRGGRAFVRHLSTTNATYLNGRVVMGEAELRAGDELWLPVALVQVVALDEVAAESV